MDKSYQYIAIEGNLGAGKTSISTKLANETGAALILEQFTDNPFLPAFYKNPERHAFPVELFFMTERFKQLEEHFGYPDLFHQVTIADYFFNKTQLFASNNLSAEEFRLFERLFRILNEGIPQPDLIVYLDRPIEVLTKHIKGRGRSFESDISEDYLRSIHHVYMEYFRTINTIPVVLIELEDQDLLENAQLWNKFTGLFEKNFPQGKHIITL